MRPTALAAIALALAALVPAAAAQGGGSVGNVGPIVRSLTSDAAYLGHPIQLHGEVSDGNGEADLVALRLQPGPASTDQAPSNHTVTAQDLANPSAPATATAGWRVWDPAPGDGRIQWSYTWTPHNNAVHAWNLTATDETLAASQWINVTVHTSGSAGGGSSPPPETPTPTPPAAQTPEATPSGSQTQSPSTGPGAVQEPEPPTDLAAEVAAHGHDLTWSLVVTTSGGQTRLAWAEVPGALGYQVWRSMSPYALRSEVPAGDPFYNESTPDHLASYKVTWFSSRDAAGGWASDGLAAAGIAGWDDHFAAQVAPPHAPPAQGPRLGPLAMGLLAAGVATVVGVLIWAWAARRPKR